MVAEEILEADEREDIKELIDAQEEEAQLDDVLEEDTIFEEAPWSEIESSEADESDVVPLSWAEPDLEGEEESSLVAEFDTESLTSEDDDEVEREAAVMLLEEMLAEEEEKQRQQQEQEEILEMVLGGEESSVAEEEEEEESSVDESTQDAIENYFRALLANNPNEEILFDDDEDEIVLGESSDATDDEDSDEETSSEFDIWDALSSVPEEDTGEIIQAYDDSEEQEAAKDDIDYNILVREIADEIQAAADEVEEEMVDALKDRLEENNMRYLEEDQEYEDEETNDASNEINEMDAANLLAQMFYQQQEKRTGSSTCPIRSLVDDCAFLDIFPDVDYDGRYRNKFQRACNRHQLCYTCGAGYGIEAGLCDKVFDAEMLAECGRDDECINMADQFLFIATNTHLECHNPCTMSSKVSAAIFN
ncbi:uncharacterized protein [Amphiura filiformis]|uniref:uncharacterized protein n=1 Tax=Amphiura filiformis TaxID=82378 RepID=UPI003B21DB60